MSSDPLRVLVVGGGLAGLSAAISCADQGAEVTLLEARGRLGGAVFSFHRDGLAVDNGQHVFLRCCTAYRSLLNRLGVGHLVTLQDRLAVPVLDEQGATAWLRRSRLPAPFHLAASVLGYSYLSRRDRLRLLSAGVALRRLNLDDERLDEQTFGQWLGEHRQSVGAVEAFWNLITLPTLNLPAAQASLALGATVFRTGLLSDARAGDLGYAVAPLSDVHAGPAQRVLRQRGASVQTSCRVERLRPQRRGRGRRGWVVESRTASFPADAVILAVPHRSAARLLPAGSVPSVRHIAGLGASPIVNVHVIYDRRVTDHPVAAGSGTPVQWVFDRTDSSGLAQGQYLAISLSAADECVAWRAEQFRAWLLPSLQRLFPAARHARVERFFVTKEATATFRQAPGTGRHRPGPVTGADGLYLAGAWTDTGWPATMEGAVRSGLAAARAALRGLGGRDTAQEAS